MWSGHAPHCNEFFLCHILYIPEYLVFVFDNTPLCWYHLHSCLFTLFLVCPVCNIPFEPAWCIHLCCISFHLLLQSCSLDFLFLRAWTNITLKPHFNFDVRIHFVEFTFVICTFIFVCILIVFYQSTSLEKMSHTWNEYISLSKFTDCLVKYLCLTTFNKIIQ